MRAASKLDQAGLISSSRVNNQAARRRTSSEQELPLFLVVKLLTASNTILPYLTLKSG